MDLPAGLLVAIREGEHTLISSIAQLKELRSVLARRHLRSYIDTLQAEAYAYEIETLAIKGPAGG